MTIHDADPQFSSSPEAVAQQEALDTIRNQVFDLMAAGKTGEAFGDWQVTPRPGIQAVDFVQEARSTKLAVGMRYDSATATVGLTYQTTLPTEYGSQMVTYSYMATPDNFSSTVSAVDNFKRGWGNVDNIPVPEADVPMPFTLEGWESGLDSVEAVRGTEPTPPTENRRQRIRAWLRRKDAAPLAG